MEQCCVWFTVYLIHIWSVFANLCYVGLVIIIHEYWHFCFCCCYYVISLFVLFVVTRNDVEVCNYAALLRITVI